MDVIKLLKYNRIDLGIWILFKFKNVFFLHNSYVISNVKTKWEVNQKSCVNYSWHLLENNMIDVTTNIYKVISGHVIFSFVFLGDNIIKENKLVWRRSNQMWHNIIKCFTHTNLYRTLNLFSTYTEEKHTIVSIKKLF